MIVVRYQNFTQKISSTHNYGIRTDLTLVKKALEILGNPQNSFPIIHIAGTNGKGSTCAITAQILREAKYKVGLTISPHLNDYRERIQVNGKWISEKEIVSCYQKISKKIDGLKLTYFEWGIVLAFFFFAEKKVDIAVIETGMGGRWDATNVVLPLVAAITNVGLDHQAYLGHTKEKILAEKMQIIKPGSVACTGVDDKKLLKILMKHCDQVGVELKRASSFIPTFKISLLGEHQKKNAALALLMIESLKEKGFEISDGAIKSGLKNVKWPGRLEIVSRKPFILLDGAHNLDGIKTLSAFLQSHYRTNAPSNQKYHLVFATLKDRPLWPMLKPLLPFAKTLTWACFQESRAYSKKELEGISKGMARHAPTFKNVTQKVMEIGSKTWHNYINKLKPRDRVLVTGSLYLVGQIRSYL